MTTARDSLMYREMQMTDPRILTMLAVIEAPILLLLVMMGIQGMAPWWVLGLALAGVVSAVLLVGLSRIVLRLDDRALRWAYVPFWWGQTALDDIEHIEVVRVEALRNFGGWGPKWKPGAFGLVAKSGGAVEITRSSKKNKLVITSDDPDRLADEILRRLLGEEGIDLGAAAQ